MMNKQMDLTEDLVEMSLVGEEGDHNQNREEEESEDCLPQVNHILQIVKLSTLSCKLSTVKEDFERKVNKLKLPGC